MINYFKTKRLSIKIGVALAVLHFSLINLIAAPTMEPNSGGLWFIVFAIDLPILPIVFLAHILIKPDSLPLTWQYVYQIVVFGLFGSAFYFFLPLMVANLINFFKKKL